MQAGLQTNNLHPSYKESIVPMSKDNRPLEFDSDAVENKAEVVGYSTSLGE